MQQTASSLAFSDAKAHSPINLDSYASLLFVV